MIWWLLSYLFFVFICKDYLFLSCFLVVDSWIFFMSSLSPLVVYLIFHIFFPWFLEEGKLIYKFLFFTVIFLVTLIFFLSSVYLFFLFLEVSSIPMAILVLNFSKSQDKFMALVFMFLINFFGSMPFMFFSIFADKLYFCQTLLSFHLSVTRYFLLVRFFLILVRKVPIFFFHFWLTKAHVRASGSCSMLLASLMLKIGTFGLFKFSRLFIVIHGKIFPFFRSLGLWGGILISLIIIRFFDAKLLVACSSIVHMSFITPFCFHLSPYSVSGSIFIMVGHGLVSYFLFFLVTILYELSSYRSYDSNKSMESFSKSLSIILFLFLFINLGVPPFLNFLREFYFFLRFLKVSISSTYLFFFFMVMGIMFTIFFVTKIRFGKKYLILFNSDSYFFLRASLFYFVYLIFYVVLISCFFSLII